MITRTALSLAVALRLLFSLSLSIPPQEILKDKQESTPVKKPCELTDSDRVWLFRTSCVGSPSSCAEHATQNSWVETLTRMQTIKAKCKGSE